MRYIVPALDPTDRKEYLAMVLSLAPADDTGAVLALVEESLPFEEWERTPDALELTGA